MLDYCFVRKRSGGPLPDATAAAAARASAAAVEPGKESSSSSLSLTDSPEPSIVTESKALAAKIWMENYFDGMMRASYDREVRRERLERELERKGVPEEKREQMRQRFTS